MRNEVIEGLHLSPRQRRLWPVQAASAAFCAQAMTLLAGVRYATLDRSPDPDSMIRTLHV